MPRKKKEKSSESASIPKSSNPPKTTSKSLTRTLVNSISGILKKIKGKTLSSKDSSEIPPWPGIPGQKNGMAPQKAGGKPFKLPRRGQTQVLVFIRDPRCLFTYWEISPEREEEIRRQLAGDWNGGYRVLRVLKISPDLAENLLQEIHVQPDEMNLYIHLDETGDSYFIEVGWKSPSGRYMAFARSGKITTATGSSSPVIDRNWAPPPGILEYFSEESGEGNPHQRPSSASMGPIQKLRKRGLGRGQHNASHF